MLVFGFANILNIGISNELKVLGSVMSYKKPRIKARRLHNLFRIFIENTFYGMNTQLTFTCSKLTIETLVKRVKSIQS